MSILIKGNNNGIAVDGDVTIEKLDFVFGEGVKSATIRKNPTDEDNIVDAEIIEESVDGDVKLAELSTTNLFSDSRGITNPGDMWLLLVAAKARKHQFDNLPKFIDWAFEKFDVPFDREECKTKLQNHMRNQPWSAIRNQEEMLNFIRDYRTYNNTREADKKKANDIYVAIRDI